MKKQLFLISFLTIVVLGSWHCNKTETPGTGCSSAWASELADEVTAITNAAQAYFADPTMENCLAYKSAAQAYVNALEPYGNCSTLTGSDRDAWQAAVNDAQESVDEIDCQ